ncbi:MAG: undecaprenyl/decaprenyl-phosphate alpha-N-acetylglucosaminyl 1-phosphate transferase [Bacteroidia bacterium]|nr:undecaprenyl/decaprenyl-phosphate alpha-N-acetylglucosaminyl 1-phosphate transferase [Bacteroidia bacterium]
MGYLALVFVTALFISLLCIPPLIKVAILKRIFDEPGGRKLHIRMVPTIGGIIIFAATIFTFGIWFPTDSFFPEGPLPDLIPSLQYTAEIQKVIHSLNDFKYVLATVIILFFVGVKDDIIGTAPIKKLAAHVVVGLILVLMANVRITSMYGIFGVHELPEYLSILLSLFTIIVVINAFNLIDGVDGLAAGVGMIACVAFGLWFHLAGDQVMSLLSFSLAGSLMGFLVFNFNPAKIFMGDSGSLVIGLIISVLAIRLIEYKPGAIESNFLLEISKPIFAMSVLVYPLIDTLRIFIYRLVRGVSPFSADKNHIHHQIIDLGLNHRQTVISVYVVNIFIISLAVLLRKIDSSIGFMVIGAVSLFFSQLPYLLKKMKTGFKKDIIL